MDLSKSYGSQHFNTFSNTNLSDIDELTKAEPPVPVKDRGSGKARKRGRRNAEKWPELKAWLWNAEERSVMGRTMPSWALIGIFYFSFYAGVLSLLLTGIGLFAVTVDEIYPQRSGWDSLMKNRPGLSHRPIPDHENTLIRFEQGKPQSYKHFTNHIQVFLDQYENERQVGENFIDCSKGRPPNTRDKVCRFNVDLLGPDCTWQKDYGYDEGQPCILLKINRMYDWEPQPLQSIDEVPAGTDRELLRPRFSNNHIGVTCAGLYSADFENVGNVTFWPAEGFSRDFYPFLNQEGYRSPLMMAKFWNPSNGVLIQVRCKAWARNIMHHAQDNMGVTKFELLVD